MYFYLRFFIFVSFCRLPLSKANFSFVFSLKFFLVLYSYVYRCFVDSLYFIFLNNQAVVHITPVVLVYPCRSLWLDHAWEPLWQGTSYQHLPNLEPPEKIVRPLRGFQNRIRRESTKDIIVHTSLFMVIMEVSRLC